MQPNADYDHLTFVGHSNGGDIAMYCAKRHPEVASKVITLDNLGVPFVLSDKLKILSFRSKGPNFKADPGVLPTPAQAKADGIDIVNTQFQHTDSDRGPVSVKDPSYARCFSEQSAVAAKLAPVPTDNPIVFHLLHDATRWLHDISIMRYIYCSANAKIGQAC